MTKKLSIVTLALVLLLSIGGFILSYSALWDMAYTYGTFPRLAWIWPLLIDFAMVVFSIGVFRASVLGERVGWTWLLVGLFTCATIGINVLHVWHFLPELTVRIIIAAIPPVALFLSFETFISMAKQEVKRGTLVSTSAMLEKQITDGKAELESLTSRVTTVRNELTELETRVTSGKKPILPVVADRRKRVLAQLQAGKSQKEIAITEGVSIKTIGLDVKSLNGKVKEYAK